MKPTITFLAVLAFSCISTMGCFAREKCRYDTISAVSDVNLSGHTSRTLVMASGRIFQPWEESEHGSNVSSLAGGQWHEGDRVLMCYRHNDAEHRDEVYIHGLNAIRSLPLQ